MAGAFDKGIVRAIKGSLGRFVAIAAIVALGCGFYAGLRMTAPDMKLSADAYYDGTAFMDIRVVSTLGLTDDDIEALRGVEGVGGVMAAYETDIMGELRGEGYAMRVHSLPASASQSDTSDGVHALSDDDDYLNRPILKSGRWPERAGECVISSDIVIATPAQVGDVIRIREVAAGAEDMLASDELQVVGTVSSPYYVTSSNLGTTSLGSGSVQDYLYVCNEEFSEDSPYTETFVSVVGAADVRSDSDEYEALVGEVEARIEAIAGERARLRTETLRADAQGELDDARAEYESERGSAEDELESALAKLDDAASQLDEAEKKVASGQASYDEGVSELAAQRASVAAQFAEAERQIGEGASELDERRVQLEDAEAQLAAGRAAFEEQSAQAEEALAPVEAQIAAGREQVAALQAQLEALVVDPVGNAQAIAALEAQIAAAQQQIDAAQRQVDAVRAQLAEARARLEAQQGALDEARAALDAACAQLAEARAELAQGRAQAAERFAQAEAQLASAKAQLESGRAEIESGRAEYEDGLAAYDDARAEADEQFADAEADLADAQQQIDDIGDAEWYVMDRDQNYGAVNFEADSNRVDSIASVFPFIFFLVAALVALTTMTRMVEEERIVIGTYKALGYSRGRIASKYLVYAAAASVLGCAVGIAALSISLPAIIMRAYGIIFFVPQSVLSVDVGLTALSAGLGIGITLAATAAAAFATLRERPASLMLPRAPKTGKRILLERIGPLWRRLSFSWKVTFRNLFRYKKRLAMTVVGIAGCTALLLTGLGLSDSINDIIDKQFGEITRYNAVIVTEDDMSDDARAELSELLGDGEYVSASMPVARESMSVRAAGGAQAGGANAVDGEKALVVAASDASRFGDFVELRTREGHDPIPFDDDSVVLSEKLARQAGVSVGDNVELVEQDAVGNATGAVHEVRVTGITENYIYYYAYVGPAVWRDIAGADAAYESELAVCTTDAAAREAFTERAQRIDGVKTITFNDETIETYEGMLGSVNSVVWVLVVAAAALAFIVVYNLTNINITERQREIATLKVLGFTPFEVDAYIYRETVLLSVIGAAVGLALGVFMEGFIIVTAEVDQVMFGREIHALSFAIAFVLTLVFTGVVMLFMRRKLGAIDMVESLKSNE